MYSSAQLAQKYIRYFLTASNGSGHGMHSPFVFDFILNVLQNKQQYEPPLSIEATRSMLLKNHQLLDIKDLGAGSRKKNAKQLSVAQLAKTALKPPKYGRFLFRLARHYQPGSILELGTSLGITTSYLAAACPQARIFTIEGSEAIAEVAEDNFNRLQLSHIQTLRGNFDKVLPSLIPELSSVDLAYIDGNHRYAPTISYFHQLLAKVHDHSILVFDDIHWSEEMERAWEEIKIHPSVQYTIDIFFLGLVFFRRDFRVKQDFQIRF